MAINDVSLTSGMRSNLLSLQNTVNLLDRTQERLSTGKKVNSAIDNPVSYFAAQSLNSRASLIDSLKDAMGQAVQTVTAADKGISAISTMIEQAKGIAQSALSAEAGTTPDATEGDADIETTYSTVSLTLGATLTDDETVTLGGETFTVLTTGGTAEEGTFADIDELAAAINANTTLTDLGYAATVSGGALTITLDGGDIATDDIGGDTDFTASEAQAHSVTMTFTVGEDVYTGSGLTAGAAATDLQTELAAIEGAATATVSDAGAVEVTYDAVPSEEMASLIEQYNTIRTQLTELAADSGYKGKNLLDDADLVVKFEGASLTVSGFDASATGLGITEAAWTGEAGINASIDELDAAAITLRTESSKLSGNLSIIAVRQDFSTNMVNTLTEGADKLTLADTNEEGANMLMLQTRQSLSTTALSMSAQAAQSVLRLFQ